jgi:hypothetical protein
MCEVISGNFDEELSNFMNNPDKTEFEKAAGERRRESLLAELWGFLKENKKWWLIPILVVLLLFGLLILLSGTSLAPFIYTLF